MLMYILYFALLGGASALAIILLCLAIEGGGKKWGREIFYILFGLSYLVRLWYICIYYGERKRKNKRKIKR